MSQHVFLLYDYRIDMMRIFYKISLSHTLSVASFSQQHPGLILSELLLVSQPVALLSVLLLLEHWTPSSLSSIVHF